MNDEEASIRWRLEYERRVEGVEVRMDRHEVQCSERYKALADTLIAAGVSRNELRDDVKELRALISRYGTVLLVAIVVIAFAAVFQESTIIEFVKQAARVWTNVGTPSAP